MRPLSYEILRKVPRVMLDEGEHHAELAIPPMSRRVIWWIIISSALAAGVNVVNFGIAIFHRPTIPLSGAALPVDRTKLIIASFGILVFGFNCVAWGIRLARPGMPATLRGEAGAITMIWQGGPWLRRRVYDPADIIDVIAVRLRMGSAIKLSLRTGRSVYFRTSTDDMAFLERAADALRRHLQPPREPHPHTSLR